MSPQCNNSNLITYQSVNQTCSRAGFLRVHLATAGCHGGVTHHIAFATRYLVRNATDRFGLGLWLWALALREFPRRSLDTVRKTNEILAAALRVVHNWPGGFLGIRHLAVSTILVFAKALARNVVVQTCVLKVV